MTHRKLNRWNRSVTMSVLGWLAMSTLLGCGDGRPKRVPISGQVLIDGQPVAHGNIRVFPADARAASGKLDSEGRFELTTFEKGDGCVLGTHTVTINALEPINASSQRWHAPAKYREVATSGLTLEVIEPTDKVIINLTWDGGEPYVEKVGDAGGD